MAKRDDPRQLNLFGVAAEPSAGAPAASASAPTKHGNSRVGPAAVGEDWAELARKLPSEIRIGTSSWSFPGWVGLVYDRSASEQTLARHGLAAYARHPLLRMVGIDRSFYAPLGRAAFQDYAAAVPEHFRFLCKAFDGVTSPLVRTGAGDSGMRYGESPHFLDAAFAAEQVVRPFVDGLGEKCGPLVFQFVPMSRQAMGKPVVFLDRLAAFLAALPRSAMLAVEIRNRELLTTRYASVLRDLGVAHCYNVHPSMPTIAEQRQMIAVETQPAAVVRWMLNRKFDYESAKNAYAPFDRIVDADVATRAEIANLCGQAAILQKLVFVAINNKAEGSAPLSLRELAREIVLGREKA
ncbi:MAG: DUF72 domain-containing protein [Phycisphaerae bacterium]